MRFEVVEAPLGELLAKLIDHRGRTPKKLGGDFVSEGVPVISAKNINEGRLVADDVRYVTSKMFEQWMPEPLLPGDVLLTSEAPLGEAAYLQGEARYCLGQRLFALRPNPEPLALPLLVLLLRSEPVRGRVLRRATGTTAQGIRQSELVKVPVPVPDLRMQAAVVEILGSLDDKIEVNQRNG